MNGTPGVAISEAGELKKDQVSGGFWRDWHSVKHLLHYSDAAVLVDSKACIVLQLQGTASSSLRL